jgi:hypothetical protein
MSVVSGAGPDTDVSLRLGASRRHAQSPRRTTSNSSREDAKFGFFSLLCSVKVCDTSSLVVLLYVENVIVCSGLSWNQVLEDVGLSSSGKLRAARAKSIKFTDGFMIHSGQPARDFIDFAVRHEGW